MVSRSSATVEAPFTWSATHASSMTASLRRRTADTFTQARIVDRPSEPTLGSSKENSRSSPAFMPTTPRVNGSGMNPSPSVMTRSAPSKPGRSAPFSNSLTDATTLSFRRAGTSHTSS